jgi:class 3 adenylate cyclase
MHWLNRLSIKSKLIVMLLTVSSCSILVTAYLGYQSGQANLTDRVFSQLTSLRASKAYQIESYFKTIRNHIQTMSEDPAVVEAMKEFATAYAQLETTQVPTQFDRSEFIGVLAVQLPVNEINNVMTGNRNWEQDGLGETGETYLVGRDYLMRSVSRFLEEKPEEYLKTLRSLGVDEPILKRIQQYKTSILETKVQTEATQQALTGKQGTRIVQDYRGISVLSSYAPLQIDGLEWAILSEIDLAEAYAPTYSFGRQVLISATLLMLLVTLLAMGLAYLFVKPIERLIESARKVESGQLDTIAKLESNDEFGELAKSFNAVVRSLRAQTELVEEKNRENERLLSSVFPAAIAKRLKRGEKDIAEIVPNVAILFANLTGFSNLSNSLGARELVTILNDLVTSFDETAEHYGIEKIKTIGDSYMAVCGLSVSYLDHDKRTVDFALEMLGIVRRFDRERGLQLNIRIGIHSGDAIAGIVGRNKFIYDVWGEAIEVANKLRLACLPGSILVSDEVYHRLDDLYEFERASTSEGNGKLALGAWQLKSIQKPVRTEA